MSNLSNQYISSSYQSLLNIGTTGSSLNSTLQTISDGLGNPSPISLSTTTIQLSGSLIMSGSIIPAVSGAYDIGSPSKPFRHGYFSSGSIYLDGNQVLTLQDNGSNTALKAPDGGTLNLLNNIVFAATNTGSIGGQFTMLGAGDNNQTSQNLIGNRHFISTNGSVAWFNTTGNTDTTSTGSFSYNIFNSGAFLLNVDNGNIDFQSVGDNGKIHLYHTSNEYPDNAVINELYIDSGLIGLISNTGSTMALYNPSGSIVVSGALYQSGTFYADNLSFAQSPSIQQNTGSYVMTYLGDGTVAYADYPSFGAAVSPYVSGSGGSGTSGTSGTDGTSGTSGVSGTSGTSGTDGTSGSSGVSGTSGSSGSSGTSPIVTNFITTGSLGLTQTITGSLQIDNNAGQVSIQDNNLYLINQYPNLSLQANVDYNNQPSGSQYTNISQLIDNVKYTNDTNAGFGISEVNGQNGINLGLTVYTPEYGGELVGIIASGKANDSGSNTALIFPSSSINMEVFKPTIFHYPVVNSQGFVVAQLPGTQTIPNGVDTIIQYTAEIDTNGWWDSEAYKFTPNVAGYYEVTAFVNWAEGDVNSQSNIQIRKNDESITIAQATISNFNAYTQNSSIIIYLNGSSDYINMTAYTSNTTSQTINGGNGTYITIKLL